MQLWKNWEDALNSMCEDIQACPGAIELVTAVASTYNNNNNNSHQQELSPSPRLPMAIATSSRLAGVETKRKKHEQGIFQHIHVIVAGDDPVVKQGKPAPDIYLEAARRLNLDPKNCLVFEDSLSGVRSGKAAGCYVVAIPDPRFTIEEKQVFIAEADMVLETLWQFDGSPFGIDIDLSKRSK